MKNIKKAYELAKEYYHELGVDTESAMARLRKIPISIPCWQGDDVGGFERPDRVVSGGGIQAIGNYPGKARNVDELRMDLQKAFSLIPGLCRLNLHAMYGEFADKKIDRNQISAEHFKGWIDWASKERIKLDFNATCFAHPMADTGFTLSSKNTRIRNFWIEHIKQCRAISAFIGKKQANPCLNNIWIPDGSKEIPVDRWEPRAILKNSLDKIFATEYKSAELKDALEGKLFGIGTESYVVGSYDFYLAYAASRGKMICLDTGHFHPTESISDKISAIMQFSDELLVHLSRGVRWDSDHVVILDDEIKHIAREIVRSQAMERIHIALDFFDASINRIAAWVIGADAALKALLMALLEPTGVLEKMDNKESKFSQLGFQEEMKTMPVGAVWNYYCLQQDVPVGTAWFREIEDYERRVLSKRGI